jgi:hypothetical protein
MYYVSKKLQPQNNCYPATTVPPHARKAFTIYRKREAKDGVMMEAMMQSSASLFPPQEEGNTICCLPGSGSRGSHCDVLLPLSHDRAQRKE